MQIILMVAFSTTDRDAFKTIFEQLTEVLNDRESVSRLVRHSTNFEAFLGELVALIED